MLNHTSLIYANFFFTDIVGLSDPRLSTKTQIKKIEMLNKLIKECLAFKTTSKDSLLVLPTGDGMVIGFFQSPELPLNLSIELHRKIDIPKTFQELNIKVYDNENQPLKISSISVDKPFQKEFTTVFNKPVIKGEKGKFYVLEYEVEEPDKYFENAFLVDCHEFIINIDYPITMTSPIVYDVNLESHEKNYCDIQPVIIENNKERAIARWKKRNIFQGQSFRLEWK